MPVKLTLQEFRRLEPSIDVTLNDDNLAASNHEIYRLTVSFRDIMGNLYVPWYLNFQGDIAKFDELDVKPVPLTEAGKFIQKRWGVNKYSEIFSEAIQLPVYKVSEKNYLILDKNHRTSALCEYLKKNSQKDARCNLLVIDGQISEEILPDLKHW